jgi:hypothetical protein
MIILIYSFTFRINLRVKNEQKYDMIIITYIDLDESKVEVKRSWYTLQAEKSLSLPSFPHASEWLFSNLRNPTPS